jgi:hypothetical protein
VLGAYKLAITIIEQCADKLELEILSIYYGGRKNLDSGLYKDHHKVIFEFYYYYVVSNCVEL